MEPSHALIGGSAPPVDAVDERILDAALAQFALVGIRRTSADDIARRAEVNRTTLYRRMGSREQIVRSAMAYEVRRVLVEIEAEVAGITDPMQRVTQAFVVTVMALRKHPLLHQLLAADREETLVRLTVDAGDLLEIATAFVTSQLHAVRAELGLPDDPAIAGLAAILVRFTHSLVLTPDAPPRLLDEQQLYDFANQHIRPLLGAA